MLGPVYVLEWRQASRLAAKYRWLFIAVLFAELAYLAWVTGRASLTKFFWPGEPAFLGADETFADLADGFVRFLVAQQVVLISLIAPAFAAGSITDEKRRGTLDFLFISPLASTEITVGKWLGQATQVLHLVSPGFVSIALLLGGLGLPAWEIVCLLAKQMLLIYTITAISLLVSVWSNSTTRAILLVYLVSVIALGCEVAVDAPAFGFDVWTMPLQRERTPLQHTLGLALSSLACVIALTLASWRLRPAHESQQDAATSVESRWWDRPPVGDAPMRWKERFIGNWMAIPIWSVMPRWVKVTLFALVIAAIALWFSNVGTIMVLGVVQFLVSGLYVAVRAAGAITGERERLTWDSLLTTHVDARQIVRGKLWGNIDAAFPYMLAYLVPALVGAALAAWWLVPWILYAWLASWVFQYYLGAAGISASVASTSTWRSILATFRVAVASSSYFLFSFVTGFALVTIPTFACLVMLEMLGGVAPRFAAGIMSAGFAVGSAVGFAGMFASTEKVIEEAENDLEHQMRGRESSPKAGRAS